MKDLNQKLAQIQTELKVKKSSYNSFGKYYFRKAEDILCLLYTSPSPRDVEESRMPSSA